MTATAILTTGRKKDANLPPESERFLRCCADIANVLIEDHESSKDLKNPRKDINLNSLRTRLSRKHKLANIPPLTAIIAAVPEHYKKYIMPKLVAKPIRASLPGAGGVTVLISHLRYLFRHRCRRRHVQTASLSPYCLHR
jgi:elongator complex protein 3